SWHWYTAGGKIEDILNVDSQEKIVHVHLNDAPAGIALDDQIDGVRDLPGKTGVIDLKGFLGALKRVGYEGPVQVEPFCSRLQNLKPEDAAREVGQSLNKVWADAGI